MYVYLFENRSFPSSRVSAKFLEHGDYWLFLGQESNGTKSCDIVIANDPMNSELRRFEYLNSAT